MKFIPPIISIAIAQLTGVLGSIFTFPAISTWYADLHKPSWNPPAYVFGPVWTMLYSFMGIAAYLVWQHRSENKLANLALIMYGVQLVLNFLWSFIFFGQRNIELAFFEIILLLLFIVITLILFWKINKWAGILLIPYLAWVLFASYLNFTIWQLN